MADTGDPSPASIPPGAAGPGERARWPFVVGGVFILLGLLAFFEAYRTGAANPLLFGVLLIMAGISEGFHATLDRGWQEFVGELPAALLFVTSGIIVTAYPAAGSLLVTLLILAAPLTGIVFRLLNSILARPLVGWQMLLTAGVVTVVLLLCLLTWPRLWEWVLGTVVGCALIWTGYEWIRRGRRTLA
jgi:uncharacterized membrane protein HdeD (DUF308 family)